ncbi:hypothetical protein L596_001030 [Steinernema carpocapsae]|uniref:Uncharacterized protein n=1 Tax=Steinernema carpocapsae TaxID=34508 RepID=A0A4U8UKK7_STECR|nr:hypothetical protein L596_001030 [Steinernema carpocapsae]
MLAAKELTTFFVFCCSEACPTAKKRGLKSCQAFNGLLEEVSWPEAIFVGETTLPKESWVNGGAAGTLADCMHCGGTKPDADAGGAAIGGGRDTPRKARNESRLMLAAKEPTTSSSFAAPKRVQLLKRED